MCISSYWIYVAPGCIVHLPLTIVRFCVDPVGIGQVYASGVDGNVHVRTPVSISTMTVLRGILKHARSKHQFALRLRQHVMLLYMCRQ